MYVCFKKHTSGNGEIEYDDSVQKVWWVQEKIASWCRISFCTKYQVIDIIYVEDGCILCVCIIMKGIKLSAFCCYVTDTKSSSEEYKAAFYGSLK